MKQWISNKRYHNIKLHQKLNTLQAETGKLLYHNYFIIHHYAAFNTPCAGHKDDESQAHIIHIHTKSKNSTLRGIRNIGSAVWAVWR